MKLAAVFLAVLLLFPLSGRVRAAETGFRFSLTADEGWQGEAVELTVSYGGQEAAGAFQVRVEYDPEVFTYVRSRESAAVRESYADTVAGDGYVASAFVQKDKEGCLAAPGEPFSYRFQVKEGAKPGSSPFFAAVYDVAGPDGEALDLATDERLTYTVLPPPSSEASLLSLTPEAGALQPEFSTDCFEYALTVPYETASLTFTAEPAAGAVCKVNRKNLGAGGTDTQFLLTVTAEDGKTRAIYRVMVHRQEKPSPSPVSSAGKAPSKTPAPHVPSASPQRAGESAASMETPAASAAPGTASAAPSQAPLAPAGVSASTPGPGGAQTGPASPSIVIRNGESSMAPYLLGTLFLGAAILFSGPLSRWIAGRLPEKEGKAEKKKRE